MDYFVNCCKIKRKFTVVTMLNDVSQLKKTYPNFFGTILQDFMITQLVHISCTPLPFIYI